MDEESFGVSFEYRPRNTSSDTDSLINFTEFSESINSNGASSSAQTSTRTSSDRSILDQAGDEPAATSSQANIKFT